MAQPLTMTKPDGVLYTRPPDVEAHIDEVVQLLPPDLRLRLQIVDRKDTRYLRSECLVHLIRQGRRSSNQALMSAVLPVLLRRCEANLSVKVSDAKFKDAASIRQNILEALTDLFVEDGTDSALDTLDFYECRFNRAFRTLRIDMVRREIVRRKYVFATVELPTSDSAVETDESQDPTPFPEALKVLPRQEGVVAWESLLDAIEALPPDERDAVVLVHVLGYKDESKDAAAETAATRCKCEGRTIRNRLKRAAAKLARFKEDL